MYRDREEGVPVNGSGVPQSIWESFFFRNITFEIGARKKKAPISNVEVSIE